MMKSTYQACSKVATSIFVRYLSNSRFAFSQSQVQLLALHRTSTECTNGPGQEETTSAIAHDITQIQEDATSTRAGK
jgi:hypothetical protein